MNLIGEKVIHQAKFGEGAIVEQSEAFVWVQFNDGKKQFSYIMLGADVISVMPVHQRHVRHADHWGIAAVLQDVGGQCRFFIVRNGRQ